MAKFTPTIRILWITTLVWVIGIATLLFATYEGSIAPVTGQLEIISVEEWRPGWSTVEGRFFKNRDCTFRGIEWYFGDRDLGNNSSVLVESFFDDPPQIRGEGYHSFGQLRVHIANDILREQAYAYVIHGCSNRFWDTRTLFYIP